MAQQKKKNTSKKNSGGRSSGSKKAAPKPAAAKSRPTAAPARGREAAKGGESLGGEIVLLVIAAFCLLLLLGNCSLAGSLGRSLRSVQMGIFGTLGFVFPLYFFWASCFFYINWKRMPADTALKLAASALTYISACGLLELLGGHSFGLPMSLAEYYRHGGEWLGGGWFGGLFYVKLFPVIGVLGTYVLLIALLIIGAVVTTGKSLMKPLAEQGGRMMEDVRAGREVRREQLALRREEEALRREEAAFARAERRREMEERRARLQAENLKLGEDAGKASLPEKKAGEMDSSWEQYSLEEEKKKPRRKKTVTAEEMNAAEEISAGEPREGQLRPRRVRRTLQELEALDRGELSDDWKEVPAVPEEEPEAEMPGVFEPVIHMGTGPAPEPEAEPAAAPVRTEEAGGEGFRLDILGSGGAKRSSAGRPARENRPAAPAEEEPSVSIHGAADALPEKPREMPVTEAPAPAAEPEPRTASLHPAAEDVSIEDSMSGYDEFAAAPLPSAWELNPAAAKTAASGGKKSGGGKKSLKDEEIWRTGDAPDGTSGITFTSQGPASVTQQAQPLQPEAPVIKKQYQFPPMDLLKRGVHSGGASAQELKATAAKLQQTLRDFGVGVTVTDISCGPSVTRYELQPDQGVKVSRIVSLQDDIKLNLAATDIRIEAPIPGKSAVGIEVPNPESETVHLRDLLDTNEFRKSASRISFGVGKGIDGQVVVTDLARMPHLLIAGATGSGKSVCINTIIMSILYKAHPDEVKLIMIDPKVVELSVYNNIPHLLVPVVTDVKKAAGALNWAVAEMTDRYSKFADMGVRDIKGYNQKVKELEDPGRKPLPQIVVIVDEMADLMMVAKAEVEEAICRLAQLARAAGIHLVLATQRPSVDVITGLIKANVPSRIAFAVSSSVDSRTILDMVGAEKLLGKGDMLFYPSNYPKPVRLQGAFVSDEEVQAVVDFLGDQMEAPVTNRDIEQQFESAVKDGGAAGGAERDELFEQAGRFIIEKDKATIGNMQRVFRIGFNRAARIMDQLADYGVVGPDEGTKAREVLMTMEEFEELLNQLKG